MGRKANDSTAIAATKPSSDLLKRLMKATGNEYGATADDVLASDITQWTTTGCYLWNMQVAGDIYKGMPNGKVVGFAGPSGTMKTYACISVIDNFLKENSNGIVFIFDSENAITKDRLESRGVTSRYVHLPVESLPDFKTQAFKLLKEINADPESKNNRYMIVLDSLGNLPSAREIKNAEEGNTAADFTRPKDIRSIFRTITVMLTKHQIPMLVTNHTYASVGCLIGGQEIIMGDGSLKPISEVKIHDSVRTMIGNKEVKKTFSYTQESTFKLELETGEVIECTENHRFLTEVGGEFKWVRAIDLKPEMTILKQF